MKHEISAIFSSGVNTALSALTALILGVDIAFTQSPPELVGISVNNIAETFKKMKTQPEPLKTPAPSAIKNGSGQWTRWLTGRKDYGYLPGTENVDSGSSGFKVYYRCSKFYPNSDKPSSVAMFMQFANDKGGDLGIVAWKRGLDNKDVPTIKFEGAASYSLKSDHYSASADPLLGGSHPILLALNSIRDYEGLCTQAYKTVEAHRPVIAKYLMHKDIESMKRLYATAKFIPNPVGLYAEGMEIALDAATSEYVSAGAGLYCTISGIVLETITKGVIRSEVMRYVLGKSCTGVVAAAHGSLAVHKYRYPLYFTGGLKADKNSDVHYSKQKWTAFDREEFVSTVQSVSVHVELAYLEAENTVKSVFFDNWR